MTKKMIKIPHYGPIAAKSFIHGPITSPYMEEMSTIGRMVMDGVKVVEVFDDGSEVELNIRNYDTDNKPKPKVEPQQQKQQPQNQQVQKNPQKQQPQQKVETKIEPDALTTK